MTTAEILANHIIEDNTFKKDINDALEAIKTQLTGLDDKVEPIFKETQNRKWLADKITGWLKKIGAFVAIVGIIYGIIRGTAGR